MSEKTSAIQAQISQLHSDMDSLERSTREMAALPALVRDLKGQNEKLFTYLDRVNDTLTDIRVSLERKQDKTECVRLHKSGNGQKPKQLDETERSAYREIIKWILLALIPALIGFFGGGFLIK